MTTNAEQAETDKAEAIKARNADMAAREEKLNEGKTGKGTRTFLSMTRGKNPQEIQYEQWDETLPATLPSSFAEVIELHKTRGQEGDKAEAEIVRRWILGDNSVMYSEASDPVAEFVDPTWPLDVQTRFKVCVKNYSRDSGVSFEDSANLFKPGIVAGLSKAK